jgi:magnesium transporter
MEKKTIQNITEQILDLVHQKDDAAIETILSEMHHADISEVLDDLSFPDAKYVFLLLNKETAAEILTDLEADVRVKLLKELSAEEIAKDFIENLFTDDAVDVLNELDEDQKEEVLTLVNDIDHAKDIADLMSYDEDTAGGIMGKELIAVNINWNKEKCLEEIRIQAENCTRIYTVYVVDDHQVLKGLISLRNILISKENSTVADLYSSKIISAKANIKAEEVAQIMEKYDLVALPIVDNINRLIGRITIDDAVDILRDEAEKDYQMASGLTEDVESDDNVYVLTRARLPWLVVGMIGGLLGAVVMEAFGIDEYVELALFAPLIAAMGGNVGVQSAAIIVQGLASNNLGNQTMYQRLKKETLVALINGLVCAILVFGTSYFMRDNIQLSQVLSISLMAVILFAALFGTFVPLTLNKLKIDPALATGPFITTANDIFGLCIYFYLAKILLGGM